MASESQRETWCIRACMRSGGGVPWCLSPSVSRRSFRPPFEWSFKLKSPWFFFRRISNRGLWRATDRCDWVRLKRDDEGGRLFFKVGRPPPRVGPPRPPPPPPGRGGTQEPTGSLRGWELFEKCLKISPPPSPFFLVPQDFPPPSPGVPRPPFCRCRRNPFPPPTWLSKRRAKAPKKRAPYVVHTPMVPHTPRGRAKKC